MFQATSTTYLKMMTNPMISPHATKLIKIAPGSRMYINYKLRGKRGIPKDAEKDDLYRYLGHCTGQRAGIVIQKIPLPSLNYVKPPRPFKIFISKDKRKEYIKYTQFS